MAAIPNLIIIGCWVIFFVWWAVSAFGQKRMAEEESFLSTLVYRTPLMLGGWLLWFPKFRYPLNGSFTPSTEFARVLGAAICVFGLLITLWSRWSLAGNWSSEVAFKPAHELVKTGPYRFVRHPIYSGLLLMCLGTVVGAGQLHSWLGFLLLGVGFWIKLKKEERLMLRHFPDEYQAYKSEVEALVPFVI